eukprot:TRINITY_DN13063_c0_g1_i1.p1 TRINITY_DN13063_c0_g1~~TRINITY_DN13063_c0_g1_i1.p1  ORF type:complete len:503 (+),score=141.40 TRINITY_DN13063_c0_g1_i1:91-1599(+)
MGVCGCKEVHPQPAPSKYKPVKPRAGPRTDSPPASARSPARPKGEGKAPPAPVAAAPPASPAAAAAPPKPTRSRRKAKSEWPWEWLTMPELTPKTTGRQYQKYLKAFKILDSVEAAAYEVWKAGDEAAAREILSNRGKDRPTPVSPATTVLSGSAASMLVSPPEQKMEDPDALLDLIEGDLRKCDSFTVHRRQIVMNERHKGGGGAPATHRKTAAETACIVQSLQSCPLFAHLVRESDVRAVADAMRKVVFAAGEVILEDCALPKPGREGLYVVSAGAVQVAGIGARLEVGDYFGEDLVSALGQRCRATFRAEGDVAAFLLENHPFTAVMSAQARHKRETYEQWLSENPPLNALPKAQLATLADALVEKKYAQGDKIIAFGELPDHMHLIVEGEVDVLGREQTDEGQWIPGTARHVCSFSVGTPVGCLEFFDDNPANNIADVVAKSEHVITAQIDKQHFEQCMGSIYELIKGLTDAPEYAYYRSVKAKHQRRDSTEFPSSNA